jgi:uncharacterized glyoxalase superfamily protein PhnB
MIMVGSIKDNEAAHPVATNTAGPVFGLYLVVEDVDAHADRARAAGAVITDGPDDKDYGGRGYSACDLEGHAWSFGSYDPWA